MRRANNPLRMCREYPLRRSGGEGGARSAPGEVSIELSTVPTPPHPDPLRPTGAERGNAAALPRKDSWAVRMYAATVLATAVLCALAAPTCAAPERIASIYLCSDQLLLRLADRDRIVSVNRFAADPAFSNEAGAVRGIHLNRGQAEDILPLNPDLVIAGAFTAPATKALLRRLGIAVLELPVEESFEDIRANIRRAAAALGEAARGERLVAELDRSLAAAPPGDGRRPELMLYRFGGYSQGRHTLTDAIFARAGFANYAASRLDGVGRLPLEKIVSDPPDAILLGDEGTERDSLAAETLAHPALRRLRATIPTLVVPDRLWLCGLANTGEAVRKLAAFRATLPGFRNPETPR